MDVQIVEAQLTDSETSSADKTDKAPPHSYKNTQVTIEKCNKGLFFVTLRLRKSVDILCQNELFPFCKN
jgi:hypothetical protein